MQRLLALITLLLAGILFATDVFALRCGRHLVKEGDSIVRAERYCPEPFWVERWQDPEYHTDYYGRTYHGLDTVEVWYLNFGPRKLMRRLVFRNGYLDDEDTLEHGFNEYTSSGQCSSLELDQAGSNIGEIYARCGPPDHEYRYPVTLNSRRQTLNGDFFHPVTVIRYVWTYYPSGNSLPRELHFQEGRLVETRTLRR